MNLLEFKRHIKFYLVAIVYRMNIDMQYKVDFIMQYIQTLIRIAMVFLFIKVLFSNTKSIYGWNANEVFLLSLYFDINKLFFQSILRGVMDIAYYIKDGGLDRLMSKPVNLLVQIVSLENGLISDLPDLLISILVFAIVLYKSNLSLTPNVFVLCTLISIILYFSVNLLVQTLNFYFIFANTAPEIGREIFSFSKIPYNFFNVQLKTFFTFIFPIFITGSTVFAIQKNEFSPLLLINITVVVIALLYFSIKFWNYSLKRYTGASS